MGVSRARLENLLAAAALGLADEGTLAVEQASGLSGSATGALLALGEFAGGATIGRLADVLGLSHSGAVRVVAQLESTGLSRRRTGQDRREVNVELTPRGRRLATRTAAARRAVVAQTVSGLSDADAAELERILVGVVHQRVRARLQRREEEGDQAAWWCRMCDFEACGRPRGRCPAQAAVADPPGP